MALMHSCDYSPAQRSQLLGIARQSITSGVFTGLPLKLDTLELPAALMQTRASFVTLKQNSELRGCTGSLEARRALALDVAQTACQTALNDPRFAPLQAHEVDRISIEISVLSPLTALEVESEAELAAALVPQVDGLVLEAGFHKATFLPKVWEQLPDPRHFLSELKNKAGLPADYWSADMTLYRYHTETFAEA